MRRRLVAVDHPLEAVHRRQVFAAFQVIAADFHLLAGKMVASEIELQLGIAGVVAGGEAADDVVEGAQRQLSRALGWAAIQGMQAVADRLKMLSVRGGRGSAT